MNINMLCRIADIDNAIRISGDGNGMRLVLDFPDVDLETIVLRLIAVRDQTLVLDLKTETIDCEPPTRPEIPSSATSPDNPDPNPGVSYRRSFV